MSRAIILEYLAALEEHNDRAWYHANKTQFQQANRAFEALIAQLLGELSQLDGSVAQVPPKELTFKLVRDTRFSHDKSPYNPSMRAHMGARGKQPVPVGYYLSVQPGGRSFLGGGLFSDVFKDATRMVRDAIASQGEEWRRIIADRSFADRFRVNGSALKKVPAGYDPAHPAAEYLKYKSWYLEYPLTDEAFLGEDFIQRAAGIFSAMKPLNDFLNRALEGFQLPAR